MAFCKNCGTPVEKGKFCPKCGVQISETNMLETINKKSNKHLKMLLGIIVVLIAIAVIVLMPHTVDEPCDWCNRRPSMAFKTSDGSIAYVCKNCSKECAWCNKKATKHYENMLGMIVFVCNDCYMDTQEPVTSEAQDYSVPVKPAEIPQESLESDEYIGIIQSYFFDCIVENAYICNEFEGYQPSAGNMILVTNVTVKNTFKEEIEMYDTDFQVQWGSSDENAFSVPITYDGTEKGRDILTNNQLPGIYSLQSGESRTGLLVFEIPKNQFDLSISYMEVFNDDSTGETFFINFHVEPLL